MAVRGYHTVTMNLVLLFCLVAVMNNVFTMSSARELNKNPSDHEKGGKVSVVAAEDPSKNKQLDKNQVPFGIPYPLPFPIPFPRLIPGFPMPLPVPLPFRMVPDKLIPPQDNFPGAGGVPSLHVPAPPPM